MKTKERIFHSVLFEAIALVFVITAATLFTDAGAKSATGLAVGLSLIAMCWNYIYNLGFDRLYGTNRIERSIKMRLGHGLGFELGMIFATLPLMMWVLQLDFWTVFVMDIGVVIFFLIYAIVFNWGYDVIRARLFSHKAESDKVNERSAPSIS
ncbi:putative membrane protein [Shewanella psychrophila]|uniref:Putative membrane protein n=1 Tax=Shewanella psychrophila TaxID=225848 RepID=A0A1S6HWP3_9GAMM|nr:PACE efflux transporter [Shewanella psychrophila]AQS39929.1 putative membrane protein [Shewanella psychrophila]